MATFPGDGSDLELDYLEFTQTERELFVLIRSKVFSSVQDHGREEQQRAFLGCASVLVDAAAQLAAKETPGIQVVQLSMLAQRICALAFDEPQIDGQ